MNRRHCKTHYAISPHGLIKWVDPEPLKLKGTQIMFQKETQWKDIVTWKIEKKKFRERKEKIRIIKYLGSLNISHNVQQPTILISCIWILSHGLHPSKHFLQPLLCLLSTFFQEIIVILWRFIWHSVAVSKRFRFKSTQTTSFSSPTQNNLLYNSYWPGKLFVVLPDLVASYMGLSLWKLIVRLHELGSTEGKR